jgi:hypothetical protein
MQVETGSRSSAAAYIAALTMAAPAGLIWWLESGRTRALVVGFVSIFFPAVVTFLLMNAAAESDRRRKRYDEQLFERLDSISLKLDGMARTLPGSPADADELEEWPTP